MAPTPEAVKKIVESKGWAAEIADAASDEPYISVSRPGAKFLMIFKGCSPGGECEGLQYFAGFNDAKNITLEKINAWNQQTRFSRAYRDGEGDPVLEMDVNLAFAGWPREDVANSFDAWLWLIDSYRKFLSEK